MINSEIKKRIVELNDEQPWNHNIEIIDGIETSPGKQTSHGKNLVKWNRIEKIIDIIGLYNKSVLDIGCNEGFFTYKLAGKGAKVVGGDIDLLRIKKAKFIQSILHNQNIEFTVLDIYSNKFQKLQKFDFCLCMGFLHRIPDPYRAIQAITQKTNMVLFEWKALKHGLHDESYAYFSPKNIDVKDFYGTEYWLISYKALELILRRLGFNYFYRIDDPSQRRAILVAGKTKNNLFDQPDIIFHRNKVKTFLSHTKRYAKTVSQIFTGKLNF